MKNRCGPPQCNGATRPLSRDCCCPSLLQLWQLPPSLLGVATAPFSTVTMRLLAGCSFTISSPHWRIVITKQHPGLFKRWFWKIPPTYYLTLLTISRDVTGCLLLVTDIPAKVPSRIPSLLCAVPSEGLSHLDKDYCNSDSALPML